MILADKIVELRKKNGWSQEEMAGFMGVSRQAVSKWESGSSIPDLNKILKMSELFNISTDCLLKDHLELNVVQASEPLVEEKHREITLDQANGYLKAAGQAAHQAAWGMALLAGSLAVLLVLNEPNLLNKGANGFEQNRLALSFAGMVLFWVAGFYFLFKSGRLMEPFEFAGDEQIELAYGVYGLLRKRKEQQAKSCRTKRTAGVLLCLLAAAAGTAANHYFGMEEMQKAALGCFLLADLAGAAGLWLSVQTFTESSCLDKLLEEGRYAPKKKSRTKLSAFTPVYWGLVFALYLFLFFCHGLWGYAWVIWIAAGACFPKFFELYRILR